MIHRIIEPSEEASGTIQTTDDIIGFIAGQPPMMDILRAVEALALPDCWIGAGFVRNVIWDVLHDRPWSPSYGDIDVVYFDADHLSPDHDVRIEAKLKSSMPSAPWSVKNQARMHGANGDPPYADTADALRHWPETCTAVAVHSSGSSIKLLAPFGVADLVTLIVNPAPAFAHKIGVYRARVAQKQWTQRWPKLRVNSLRD
jgi:uncharacterized protein